MREKKGRMRRGRRDEPISRLSGLDIGIPQVSKAQQSERSLLVLGRSSDHGNPFQTLEHLEGVAEGNGGWPDRRGNKRCNYSTIEH